MGLISVVNRTGDRKLSETGNMAATWVPQQSCHDDCVLKKNGCYAEVGRAGLHTHRLNSIARMQKKGLAWLRVKLAKLEAAAIDLLPADRKLRVHVVGDCATKLAARIVGAAMARYEQRGFSYAYTYTHSWRHVMYSDWRSGRAMASLEHPEDIPLAKANGYKGIALIVPPHPTNKVYRYYEVNVLPCPAQFFQMKDGRIVAGSQKEAEHGRRLTTCEKCTLCQRHDELDRRGLVIGFEPDGQSTKRILRMIT